MRPGKDGVLTINSSDSQAVDVDILTAKLPEKRGILEGDGECRSLPVLDVLAESDRPQDRNVNVLEEGQVSGRVDAVGFIWKEDDRSSIVALICLLDQLGTSIFGQRVDDADAGGVAAGAFR